MIRLTLADGRWLELRPMYISDRLALVDLGERVKAEDLTVLDYLSALADVVVRAVESKSWDGSLLEMSPADLQGLFNDWLEGTDAQAVPLASAATSPQVSPESSSEAPMADQSA